MSQGPFSACRAQRAGGIEEELQPGPLLRRLRNLSDRRRISLRLSLSGGPLGRPQGSEGADRPRFPEAKSSFFGFWLKGANY